MLASAASHLAQLIGDSDAFGQGARMTASVFPMADFPAVVMAGVRLVREPCKRAARRLLFFSYEKDFGPPSKIYAPARYAASHGTGVNDPARGAKRWTG